VADDGQGFDAEAALADPEHGHFGLQLLAELAASGGGTLQVASAPGLGTRWRLRMSAGPAYDDERDGVR
jgi:signal transduction histidine kinase